MQGLLSSLAFHTNLFSARSKPYGDGLIFRLHYRITFALLMGSCLLVTATQYIGAPISCLADESLPPNVVNTYCYIAATFTLPSTLAMRTGRTHSRLSDQKLRDSEHKRHQNYYMWVPYVLFLQSISFYAPHWLWKMIQSDKVRVILQGLNYVVVDEDQRHHKETLMVNYLAANWGSHNYWAIKYIMCESLNFANVLIQFLVTDRFLGGQFRNYGTNVLSHWRNSAATTASADDFDSVDGRGTLHDHQQQQQLQEEQQLQNDPMEQTFPRLTKCTFYKYGSSGTLERYDALCVLSINVINDKIYLTLWFWYIFLLTLNSVLLVYRLSTIFSPSLRTRLLRVHGGRHGADPAIDDVAKFSSYGDWYMLRTLSRTMSGPVFGSVVRQLALRLPMYESTTHQFPV